MKNDNKKVLDAADAATDQSSSFIDCSNIVAASAQAVVTGTATGTIQFQGSNDPLVGYPNATTQTVTNWSNLGSSVAIAGAGVYMLQKIDIAYQFIRVKFVNTANTGAITINLKTLGF